MDGLTHSSRVEDQQAGCGFEMATGARVIHEGWGLGHEEHVDPQQAGWGSTCCMGKVRTTPVWWPWRSAASLGFGMAASTRQPPLPTRPHLSQYSPPPTWPPPGSPNSSSVPRRPPGPRPSTRAPAATPSGAAASAAAVTLASGVVPPAAAARARSCSSSPPTSVMPSWPHSAAAHSGGCRGEGGTNGGWQSMQYTDGCRVKPRTRATRSQCATNAPRPQLHASHSVNTTISTPVVHPCLTRVLHSSSRTPLPAAARSRPRSSSTACAATRCRPCGPSPAPTSTAGGPGPPSPPPHPPPPPAHPSASPSSEQLTARNSKGPLNCWGSLLCPPFPPSWQDEGGVVEEVGVEEEAGGAVGRGAVAGRGGLPVPSRREGEVEEVGMVKEPKVAGGRGALPGRGGCGSRRPPRSTREEEAGRRATRHSGGSSRREARAYRCTARGQYKASGVRNATSPGPRGA